MNELREFWSLVTDVWQHGVAGVDVGRMAAAVGVFLLFLMLRGLMTRFLMAWLRLLTNRTPWTIDDQILETIVPPVRFIPIVMGLFFATQIMELQGTPDQMAGNLIRSLVAFTIFWGLFRAIEPLSVLLHKLDRIFSEEMVDWLRLVRISPTPMFLFQKC